MIAYNQLGRCLKPLRSHIRCNPSRAIWTLWSSSPQPRISPPDVLIEEERTRDYQAEHFFPADPGHVLNDRYKLLTKIGWGSSSTVWLAKDMKETPLKHVSIKICISSPDFDDMVMHELNINERLNEKASQSGSAFIRIPIDDFVATGPAGIAHLCLVFEPLREPISRFQYRLAGDCIPPQLLKVWVGFILEGLEYLHNDCQIVHTDLKAENILLTFEDKSVLDEYVKAQADHPMPRKRTNGRNIYLSHNDFGDLKSYVMLPKIVDFGLAQQVVGKDLLRHPIQPPLYHAPEVLLGIPWSYSADIWNLGVLLFELLENQYLFDHLKSQNGVYTPQAHLAEMIALFGPPPRKLIEQERYWRNIPWERAFPNKDGIWVHTAREYYGGPFFDPEGRFTKPEIIPFRGRLEECITCMSGEEKEFFITFVRKMLQWLPEDRKTATELREDPWLKSGLD